MHEPKGCQRLSGCHSLVFMRGKWMTTYPQGCQEVVIQEPNSAGIPSAVGPSRGRAALCRFPFVGLYSSGLWGSADAVLPPPARYILPVSGAATSVAKIPPHRPPSAGVPRVHCAHPLHSQASTSPLGVLG